MELSLFEFAKSMNTDPGIVERWIRQGRIPVKRKGDVCVFNKEILEKWASAHNMRFVMSGSDPAAMAQKKPAGLLAAMKKGGVHYDVPGSSVSEVLRAAVDRIDGIQAQGTRDLLYEKLLDREKMMSTGIGGGVAVPHPRTPIQDENMDSLIAACFLKNRVDFHAVDKKPVGMLFVLVAPSAKHHLHLLSRVSFCLRDDSFLAFLKSQPDRHAFFNEVAGFESRLDPDEQQ
ncbi:MAG: PTS sugar transporter subunit IIA [Desulfosalsimonadaceae bacterium]